jgi:hypothetical protein
MKGQKQIHPSGLFNGEQGIIQIDSVALKALVDQVITYMKEVHNIKNDNWLSTEQAMELLKITSKTTLMRLKNEGKIAFSSPMKKVQLFSRESIEKYLNDHIHPTF